MEKVLFSNLKLEWPKQSYAEIFKGKIHYSKDFVMTVRIVHALFCCFSLLLPFMAVILLFLRHQLDRISEKSRIGLLYETVDCNPEFHRQAPNWKRDSPRIYLLQLILAKHPQIYPFNFVDIYVQFLDTNKRHLDLVFIPGHWVNHYLHCARTQSLSQDERIDALNRFNTELTEEQQRQLTDRGLHLNPELSRALCVMYHTRKDLEKARYIQIFHNCERIRFGFNVESFELIQNQPDELIQVSMIKQMLNTLCSFISPTKINMHRLHYTCQYEDQVRSLSSLNKENVDYHPLVCEYPNGNAPFEPSRNHDLLPNRVNFEFGHGDHTTLFVFFVFMTYCLSSAINGIVLFDKCLWGIALAIPMFISGLFTIILTIYLYSLRSMEPFDPTNERINRQLLIIKMIFFSSIFLFFFFAYRNTRLGFIDTFNTQLTTMICALFFDQVQVFYIRVWPQLFGSRFLYPLLHKVTARMMSILQDKNVAHKIRDTYRISKRKSLEQIDKQESDGNEDSTKSKGGEVVVLFKL